MKKMCRKCDRITGHKLIKRDKMKLNSFEPPVPYLATYCIACNTELWDFTVGR